jgi:hypothetical protein
MSSILLWYYILKSFKSHIYLYLCRKVAPIKVFP